MAASRRAEHKDFGVFLPVANGGWIISDTTPRLDGLWKQNLAAAVTADEVGMDFVMSMGKWRGFGGDTDHWGTSMESHHHDGGHRPGDAAGEDLGDRTHPAPQSRPWWPR